MTDFQQDVLAYFVIAAFVVFVVAPILPSRSGESYWKCVLMGNAALALIAAFAAFVLGLLWAFERLFF